MKGWVLSHGYFLLHSMAMIRHIHLSNYAIYMVRIFDWWAQFWPDPRRLSALTYEYSPKFRTVFRSFLEAFYCYSRFTPFVLATLNRCLTCVLSRRFTGPWWTNMHFYTCWTVPLQKLIFVHFLSNPNQSLTRIPIACRHPNYSRNKTVKYFVFTDYSAS